jgi:Protein of unknown function (DUF3035)
MRLRLLLILAAPLLLAACTGIREDLGLGRAPPDEFAVVDRPPLSMPPDFDLRPPRPGAPRPQDVDPNEQASKSLFSPASHAAMSSGGASGAEKALLAQTGAEKADPNIRDTVNRETSQKVAANEHLVRELLDWVHGAGEKPAATVDAAAEAARIKDAKDKGEPLNKGATPVIERDKTGWLGL